jgi:hypothetical protein
MYARVVRFTDVKPDQIDRIKGEVEGGGGPPPGVNAKGIKVMVDDSQGTAVVVLFFDSEEDMTQADAAMDAMDSGETPGNRASVDRCEVKASMDA